MSKLTKQGSIARIARNTEIYRHHKQGFSLSILSEFYNLDKSVISRVIKEQQLSRSQKVKKPKA